MIHKETDFFFSVQPAKRMVRHFHRIVLASCLCVASLYGMANAETLTETEEAEAAFEPFYHIDMDDPAGYKKDLSNVRFLTKGKYELADLNVRYGVDPEYDVDTRGMDTLNISSSAQFSEYQFRVLAKSLKEAAGDKQIYIIDLREESHAFLNGIPVSWYDFNNWGNDGLTREEVLAAEEEQFGSLEGSTITAYGVDDNERGSSLEIEVKDVKFEQELVENEGFIYVRFPARDHSWPDEYLIDDFIEFVKGIDIENSWLHFHSETGSGRDTVFMEIYDMLKNPEITYGDVTVRHAKAGGTFIPYVSKKSKYTEEFALRAKRNRQVYQYIQENQGMGFKLSWQEWLERHD